MRWIVYLLLFANLGLFIWKIRDHQQAPAPGAPPMTQGNQVNRLPLLSEMSNGALRAREPESVLLSGNSAMTATARNATDPDANSSDGAGLRECYTVGPFREELATAKVRAWLLEHQANLAVRVDERRETARYWVYFPPLASRNAAVARVEEMRTAGIQDLIIIPRGDMSNAISLGVYNRKASVDRRLAQLRAKGYQPSVVPRYRTVKATWVDVLVTDTGVDMGVFLTAFPDLDVNRRNCSTIQIASTPKPAYNPQPPQRQYHYSNQESNIPGDTSGDDSEPQISNGETGTGTEFTDIQ